MSWPVASFVLLVLALALGFAWYERSRPGSRVLALVATLAALAVVGRIAFAPLPNVKPTTDIVLLSGYVLGGAPGFAVGAVSALASNLFFGQGPWTPWQMAAWGLCGLFGAGLGAVSRRRLPRVPLALCCGAAGLGFGAIMDFSTWVTFTGQHTLAQYLTISGVSLSFNIAHAIGNVLFCLAFGPALVRALQRYRVRLTVVWAAAPAERLAATAAMSAPGSAAPSPSRVSVRPLAVAALVGIAVAAWAGALGAPAARADARAAALGYLAAARNPDGGFGADRGQPTSPLYSAWAAMGLVAAGRPCPDGLSTVLARDGARVRATGDVERTVLGLRACGTPADGLVRRLAGAQQADGSFDGLVNATAFAIFSLRAAGRSTGDAAVGRATRWLAGQANRDGGFNFGGRGGPSGIDDTAAALQGLRSGGRSPRTRAVRRAAAFLIARQNADGGFPLTPGGASNAQSTAWAIQGVVAAGVDPARLRRGGSRSPLAYLQSLSAPDGAVRYSRTSGQTPVWVTAQALTALARRPFPILPRTASRAAGPLAVARELVLRAADLLG